MRFRPLYTATLFVLVFTASTTVFAAFTDVPSGHPYADAITYVQSQGIVQGYGDGSFKPQASINRAEFMKIVMGATSKQEPQGGNCFPDVSDQWFAPFVCSGKLQGIVGGYPDGTFRPSKNISFVEGAKIIVNAFGLPISPDSAVWYKEFVVALEQKHAIPVEIATFDQLLTRGQMAEIIYRLHTSLTSRASKTYDELAGKTALPAPPSSDPCASLQEDACALFSCMVRGCSCASWDGVLFRSATSALNDMQVRSVAQEYLNQQGGGTIKGTTVLNSSFTNVTVERDGEEDVLTISKRGEVLRTQCGM